MLSTKIKNSILGTIIAAGTLAAVPLVGSNIANSQNSETTNVSLSSDSKKQTKGSNILVKPEDDNPIELWTTWTEGGAQSNAMIWIAESYNDYVKTKYGTNFKGHHQIRVIKQTGNYSGASDLIKQLALANTPADMPDIYINYSDVPAILLDDLNKSNAKPLNLSIQAPELSENLIDTMNKQNEMIAGGEEGAIYTIPFATSSEMMVMDAPTLVWMLQQYKANGGKIEVVGDIPVVRQLIDATDGYKDGSITSVSEDGTITQDKAVYAPLTKDGTTQEDISDVDISTLSVGSSSSDKTRIETVWSNRGNKIDSTLTIDENTFASGKGLAKFANEILKVVKLNDSETNGALIGFDAVENSFYSFGQGLEEENGGKGLISKENNDVVFNLLEQDSAEWKTAADILDYFLTGFDNGSMWVPNGDKLFGSNQVNSHLLPISIGSTAGGTHFGTSSPEELNPGEIVFTQAPGKLEEDSKHNIQMQQGPGIGGIDKGDADKNESIASFMDWFVGDQAYSIETPGSAEYIYPVGDKNNWDLVKTATNLGNTSNWVNPFSSDDEASKDSHGTWHGKVTDEVINAAGEGGWNPWGKGITQDQYDSTHAPTGMYTDSYNNPWGWWKIQGTDSYVIADSGYGLELFGFDGTKPTYGTKAMVVETKDWKPSVYMSHESNYIVGTKTVFEDKEYAGQVKDEFNGSNGSWSGDSFKLNDKNGDASGSDFTDNRLIGPSIAYSNIESAIDESATDKVELELEPYSIDTSTFRTSVRSELTQAKIQAASGKKMDSADDILIDLHNKAVRLGFFDGKEISTGMEWWAWLLIAIGSVIVIGGIVGGTIVLVKKKKGQSNSI